MTILSLDPDGSVHAQLVIGEGLGGFGGALEHDDYFGSGLTELADLDGDLVPELSRSEPRARTTTPAPCGSCS